VAIQRLAAAARRPALQILVGRAINQGGLFAFLVAASLRLPDLVVARFAVAVTVASFLAAGPVLAVQMSAARVQGPGDHATSTLRSLSILLLVTTVASGGVASAISGPTLSGTLVVLATGCFGGTSALAFRIASLGRSAASAATEALAGGLLAISVVVSFVVRAGAVWWGVSMLAATASSMLAAVVVLVREERRRRLTAMPFGPWGLVVQGRTMAVMGLVSGAYNRVDLLVLSIVASSLQTTRYALAGRFVGPLLVILSSLNNSLYVRQVAESTRAGIAAVTAPTARRVLRLSLVVSPVVFAAVWGVSRVISGLGARDLVAPSGLLLAAAVFFAATVPWSFAFSAAGRELWWLLVMAVGVVLDAGAVAVLGDHGATTVAGCWLVVQALTWLAVEVIRRRAGFRPDRVTVP
jgi:hypothetical protein